MKSLFAILTLAATITLTASVSASAQEKNGPTAPASQEKVAEQAEKPVADAPVDNRIVSDEKRMKPSGVSPKILAGRIVSKSEEDAEIIPYYNNFLSTYRLGPEDVISVEVFDQPRYSKAGITIPPTGVISYIHIKGGISVVGKTTQEVAEEIKAAYEEYIIDPVVNVTLDKVGSARFSIVGDVAQPGVRLMTHRYSVREAINEAGGVLATGDKKKVAIARNQGEGRPLLLIPVNLAMIEKGKMPDAYLAPGDQILVPGNRLKTFRKFSELFSVISFARILTGGF